MPVRHTPYHQEFVELGAEMVDRIGFECAFRFTSIEEEHLATRNAVGFYDVYRQGPIDIKGPDAEALLQKVTVRDVARRLTDGGVLYTSLCNQAGGMIDDLTVYRLSPEQFWVVATPARADVVEAWLREQGRGMRVYVTNSISGTAYLSIQGPRSRELLAGLCDADLSSDALPYFRFVWASVTEVPSMVSRTGYSGELGYELYYARDWAHHVWASVFAAGNELGARPCGLGALRSVRIEKKYPLYGLDLDESTSPLEASLGWTVDLDKGPFVGREALAKQTEERPSRRLVGIALEGTDFVPAPGDGVEAGSEPAGTVTSGDRGHFVGRSLAMAYLSPEVEHGARVIIRSAETNAEHPGVVSTVPFHDPEGVRLRA